MAPPPRPRPPDPAVLIDELVEEFLLRLPPEDPALLARAALVSRQWYRVVTGHAFRRRFRELYRSTTPLLGYILNLADSARFVPLSSFRPPHAHRPGVRAVSSSHGRVLLHRLLEEDLVAPRFPVEDLDVLLSVWNPVADEQQDLPVVPLRPTLGLNWDAAVICAVGDGCDHLGCHFMVVFVGNREYRNFTCFYSSEAGSWSDPVFAAEVSGNVFVRGNFVLIGTAFYTTSEVTNEIFKYDLQTHQMSNISITPGPDLLEPYEAILAKLFVLAFAETGAGVIFLSARAGYFTIDLKSGSCKKVGGYSTGCVVPYVSFCTPVPGAVSTDDRPGAGVAIYIDEVPVADVAVSADEGPGAGVAVSADVGPGAAGMCQVP